MLMDEKCVEDEVLAKAVMLLSTSAKQCPIRNECQAMSDSSHISVPSTKEKDDAHVVKQ